MSCILGRVLRPASGIYVINESTLASDTQVAEWTKACATQLVRDVAPAYGRKPVKVQFLTRAEHAPRGSWVISVLDDADQADALGYHTIEGGRVYGRVFLRPCRDSGVSPSTTLSHEVIETYCDPQVNRWVATGGGYSVPYEACDAVQGGSYIVDGVPVSDFVYPRWYDRNAHSGQFSYLATIHSPFEIAPAGYVTRLFGDGSEDQVFGSRVDHYYLKGKAHAMARTVRRSTNPAGVPAQDATWRDLLGGYAKSLVRTYAPYLIGGASGWLTAHNIPIPADIREQVTIGLVSAGFGAYYAAVRALELKWPSIGVLLGHRAQPLYLPVGADATATIPDR